MTSRDIIQFQLLHIWHVAKWQAFDKAQDARHDDACLWVGSVPQLHSLNLVGARLTHPSMPFPLQLAALREPGVCIQHKYACYSDLHITTGLVVIDGGGEPQMSLHYAASGDLLSTPVDTAACD